MLLADEFSKNRGCEFIPRNRDFNVEPARVASILSVTPP
jgi:hypothetical protein